MSEQYPYLNLQQFAPDVRVRKRGIYITTWSATPPADPQDGDLWVAGSWEMPLVSGPLAVPTREEQELAIGRAELEAERALGTRSGWQRAFDRLMGR